MTRNDPEHLLIALGSALLIALTGCSKSEENTAKTPAKVATTQSQPSATQIAPSSPVPATPAPPGEAVKTPSKSGGSASNAIQTPPMPPQSARVKKVLQAGGYTYLQVDREGAPWLATPTVTLREGDKVTWGQGTIMKNFPSKPLNRTFEEVVFVGNLKIEPIPQPATVGNASSNRTPKEESQPQQQKIQQGAPAKESRDPAVRRSESGKPVQKTPTDKPAAQKTPPAKMTADRP